MYFPFRRRRRRRRLRSCTHIYYTYWRECGARNDRAWACCMGSSSCVRRTCETKSEENENNRNVIIPRLLRGCGAQELTDAAWLIIILRSLGIGVTISPKNTRWCGNARYICYNYIWTSWFYTYIKLYNLIILYCHYKTVVVGTEKVAGISSAAGVPFIYRIRDSSRYRLRIIYYARVYLTFLTKIRLRGWFCLIEA